MNNNTTLSNFEFSKVVKDFGQIKLRHFDMDSDIQVIYPWVTKPYAKYWGMTSMSLEEIRSEYIALVSKGGYDVFMGYYKDQPVFLMEKYKVSKDRIAQYYNAQDTDYGMHVLIAPLEQRIPNFTWHIFSSIVDYFFEQPDVKRIVVEPDVRNEKIHKLNKKAGFVYQKEINLPEKRAALAFCEYEDYQQAKASLASTSKTITDDRMNNVQIQSTIDHLKAVSWKKANIALVRKAISEFSHELVLRPQMIEERSAGNHYLLISDIPGISYEFVAQKKALDHWDIIESTLIKKKNGNTVAVDMLQFIVEFNDTLKIPEVLLPTYLEEISSTLSSAAYKITNQEYASHKLATCSFQIIEHAMTEGHPCFVANNGRIGFDSEDYIKYAPETNRPFRIYWLAGHTNKTNYTATKKYTYKSLIKKELGITTVARFHTKLESMGLDIESYIFIPVHPWQWHNKITQVFAADIANDTLVFLGESDDYYLAQQSIRTLYNTSYPEKMYTKTALSILNMGFMRGLSPYYMQSTPHITEWITELLEKDSYLKKTGFTMLGEVATVGFQNTYYEVLGKTNAHNKMLSALWRESALTKIKAGQQLMTMAAFLHIDSDNNSLVAEIIKLSPHDTCTWIRRYLRAYLSPLVHCFYAYELVFMPHGENIIMVLDNHTPIKILMKDITEEVIVFDTSIKMPKEVARLRTQTSDKMKVLSLFTDVFDCFFRFLSTIIENHLGYPEDWFWELVAECVHQYQLEHPEYQSKFEKYDLFVAEFDRCCLNRLQLQNTRQMLNLADPIDSLILDGTLQNPIAKFKQKFQQLEAIEHQNNLK
ncbi:GNAT family N-acetyltransferase [Aquimarina sp. U1-2]|uniref:GNAT family N-acetyltransferase n=1 Tax=Aquimarina sp. U1-2 TaxID=2823141 RepID=UPI001AECAC6E|nr:GNAT family N-acetyltransferase [Aquimarina sp. U1-2]MBP2831639.1 GNAT family N-acetyltransferase [Aquimarina sp. U1-2]